MARKRVLELMEELVGLHFPNLCLCIMSHLEFNICNTLEPVTTQQLSLHDESRQIWDINNYITDLSPGSLPHPHLYIHPSHLSSQPEQSGTHFLLTNMLGTSSPAVRQQDTLGLAIGQWDTLSLTIRQWYTSSPTVRLVRHSL